MAYDDGVDSADSAQRVEAAGSLSTTHLDSSNPLNQVRDIEPSV